MWNAWLFDWRKWLAARAMKQRATFLRACLSQQLAVWGLYFVHRWFAHGPPRALAAAGAAAAAPATRSISMKAAASAARRVVERIVDDHLRRVGARRARRSGTRRQRGSPGAPGRPPAGEVRRGRR